MGPPCSWVVVYFGSTARLKSGCLCQLRLCTIIQPLHDLVKEINRNNYRKAVAAQRAVFLSQFTWNRQTDQRVDWGSWSLAAGTLRQTSEHPTADISMMSAAIHHRKGLVITALPAVWLSSQIKRRSVAESQLCFPFVLENLCCRVVNYNMSVFSRCAGLLQGKES